VDPLTERVQVGVRPHAAIQYGARPKGQNIHEPGLMPEPLRVSDHSRDC
jgi:hypothetical protein